MQQSTLLRTQWACWDRAAKPQPCCWSFANWPTSESMASAYTCMGMHAMWSNLNKGMLILTHPVHVPCTHCCNMCDLLRPLQSQRTIQLMEPVFGVEVWFQGCEKEFLMKAFRGWRDRQITINDHFKVEQQKWKGIQHSRLCLAVQNRCSAQSGYICALLPFCTNWLPPNCLCCAQVTGLVRKLTAPLYTCTCV